MTTRMGPVCSPHNKNAATCDECLSEVTNHSGVVRSNPAIVSVDEGTMDQMIQRASVPNLASLFKAGKAAGLIKPGAEYGHAV